MTILFDSARKKLNQLHSPSLHVVVDVDVALCDGDGTMPCQTGQHSHPNAFAGQRGDEVATPTVATAPTDACPFVHPVEVLTQRVG